ncbi:zinc finger CCCH domain-containing protein 25-like [Zingiber officinale]|uniref:zinc finger CCCH domain-containing protein 25-like n=1 Tax=Zingiber officinale TaxID=94328 RepID=UPI001C4AB827|nr:zinc finger CCCH domain-containing protein 25-like [Zingiber officinale]
MNPLTLVKRTQKINLTEAALGISDGASWHAKYKDSAYIFIGGISFDLTEGDLLAVFAQYGEVVDVNLVRDKATGKSKGFAFLAYEDQRSTILAVDNLNGAKILGRIVRVDHVSNYKKKEEEEEDAEERQKKREARGVCRAFQRGECKWGDACKFSHDEQRCANTGWGAKDREPRWNHDKYDEPPKSQKKVSQRTSDHNDYHHKAKDGDDEDIHHRKSKRDHYSERWRLKGDHEEKRHRHERERSTRHRSREDEESQRRTRT